MNKFETKLQQYIQNTIVDVYTDCILWTGPVNKKTGYALIYVYSKAKTELAHRYFYTLFTGKKISADLDHTCNVRRCINIEHLEDVSRQMNIKRSYERNPKTHCKRGHEFTPENTRVSKTGKRTCLTCWR